MRSTARRGEGGHPCCGGRRRPTRCRHCGLAVADMKHVVAEAAGSDRPGDRGSRPRNIRSPHHRVGGPRSRSATVRGPVDIQHTAATAAADHDNVQGVGEVNADQVKAPAQTGKVDYYIIQQGDSLSAIAKKFLGNANAYPKIFEANREVIQDPDKIYAGQKIRIPLE